MNRKEVLNDIENTLGLVPTMFRSIPDQELGREWELFKLTQLGDTPIPSKERQLIGLAVAAATRCAYCTIFHTEVARLFGATNEEIEQTVYLAKASVGWSTYVNGMQVDLAQFRKEVKEISNHVRSSNPALARQTGKPSTAAQHH